jgi:hypothetical protein
MGMLPTADLDPGFTADCPGEFLYPYVRALADPESQAA